MRWTPVGDQCHSWSSLARFFGRRALSNALHQLIPEFFVGDGREELINCRMISETGEQLDSVPLPSTPGDDGARTILNFAVQFFPQLWHTCLTLRFQTRQQIVKV